MTSTQNLTVTPQDRFAAIDRHADLSYWHALEMSGEGYALSREQHWERHAISNAREWEAFPEAYTPQQQRAAARLLVAIGDVTRGLVDREDADYLAAVRGVMALLGAER